MAAETHLAEAGYQVPHTPTVERPAGFIVVVGNLIGICQSILPANKPGNIKCGGVDYFDKATGASTAIAAGTTVYLEVAQSHQRVTAAVGANLKLGTTVLAVGDNDTRVLVIWNPCN